MKPYTVCSVCVCVCVCVCVPCSYDGSSYLLRSISSVCVSLRELCASDHLDDLFTKYARKEMVELNSDVLFLSTTSLLLQGLWRGHGILPGWVFLYYSYLEQPCEDATRQSESRCHKALFWKPSRLFPTSNRTALLRWCSSICIIEVWPSAHTGWTFCNKSTGMTLSTSMCEAMIICGNQCWAVTH